MSEFMKSNGIELFWSTLGFVHGEMESWRLRCGIMWIYLLSDDSGMLVVKPWFRI